MHNKTHILLIFSAIFILIVNSSCNRQYQKVLKGDDTALKMEFAEKYFNEGDCNRAIPLLRDLIALYRGTPGGEKVYYYYSFCQYSTNQFVMAAHYFDLLARSYPFGQYAEEATFLYANSLYRISPGPSLDQTNTKKAIRGFQNFVNRFPESKRVDEAHLKMDELLKNIESKDFQNALLYYQIHEYRAAVWALRSFIQIYPASKNLEQAYFYKVKAQFHYAEMSVKEKQAERFRNVILEYNDFKEAFPQSPFLSDLENKLNTAKNNLNI